MTQTPPLFALLSTGDEITNGDILNTNSQYLAQQLLDHNIQPGMHLTVDDEQTHIESAIRFLLQSHTGLIISGGLGPTSDDRTRFALSEALKEPLVFDEPTWERVVARVRKFTQGAAVPENNRQQCLFPAGATIFPNDHGTASGCQMTWKDHVIFMLPGPPFECYPMFEQDVLPYLMNQKLTNTFFRREWLLLNTSEAKLAQTLDPLSENSHCQIGYRVDHPYLEVKLKSKDQTALDALSEEVTTIINQYIVSQKKQKASTQLMAYLLKNHYKMCITDHATGGLLQTTLLNPNTFPYLYFSDSPKKQVDIHLTLSGLSAYWQGQEDNNLLHLKIDHLQKTQAFDLTIPFRQARTPLYAVEMACLETLKTILTPRNTRPYFEK